MGKHEIINAYWMDYLKWSENMLLNQAGNVDKNKVFFEPPTEENFWRWWVLNPEVEGALKK